MAQDPRPVQNPSVRADAAADPGGAGHREIQSVSSPLPRNRGRGLRSPA